MKNSLYLTGKIAKIEKTIKIPFKRICESVSTQDTQ